MKLLAITFDGQAFAASGDDDVDAVGSYGELRNCLVAGIGKEPDYFLFKNRIGLLEFALKASFPGLRVVGVFDQTPANIVRFGRDCGPPTVGLGPDWRLRCSVF